LQIAFLFGLREIRKEIIHTLKSEIMSFKANRQQKARAAYTTRLALPLLFK